MASKSPEAKSLYYMHNPNRKFWYYKSDPGVKHNNHQCRTCIYRTKDTDGDYPLTSTGCEYILVTGHMRGCHPSPTCMKYVKGKRKSRRGLFNPHGKGFKSPEEPMFIEIGDGYTT